MYTWTNIWKTTLSNLKSIQKTCCTNIENDLIKLFISVTFRETFIYHLIIIARRRRQLSDRSTTISHLYISYECNIQQTLHEIDDEYKRRQNISLDENCNSYKSYDCTSNKSRSYKLSYNWDMRHAINFAKNQILTQNDVRTDYKLLNTLFHSSSHWFADKIDSWRNA